MEERVVAKRVAQALGEWRPPALDAGARGTLLAEREIVVRDMDKLRARAARRAGFVGFGTPPPPTPAGGQEGAQQVDAAPGSGSSSGAARGGGGEGRGGGGGGGGSGGGR
jgi:hypothetical protein